MNEIKETAIQLVQNPKTGMVVAGGTLSSGLAKVMEWIPDDIGKLATLVGIVFSSTLIYVHLTKLRIERQEARRKAERDELELAILRDKLEEISHSQ